jgi:hypothetical protein
MWQKLYQPLGRRAHLQALQALEFLAGRSPIARERHMNHDNTGIIVVVVLFLAAAAAYFMYNPVGMPVTGSAGGPAGSSAASPAGPK